MYQLTKLRSGTWSVTESTLEQVYSVYEYMTVWIYCTYKICPIRLFDPAWYCQGAIGQCIILFLYIGDKKGKFNRSKTNSEQKSFE